jgi:hypothetical protein
VASFRSECVAEILWELKKIDKLATFSEIAGRAGFKAGVDGKTLATCIETIKKDWPHLQWWRAVPDDCDFKRESDHVRTLEEAGIEFAASRGRKTVVTFANPESVLYTWETLGVEAAS